MEASTSTVPSSEPRHLGSSNAMNLWLRLVPFLRYLFDAATLIFVFVFSVISKTDSFPDSYRIVLVIALMSHILVYAAFNIYSSSSSQSLWRSFVQISVAWYAVALILLTLAFVTKTTSTYSRQVFLQWLLIVPSIQVLGWLCVREISRKIATQVSVFNRSLIIGSGSHALRLSESLAQQLDTETLTGFVVDAENADAVIENNRLLGHVDHIRDVVKGNRIRKIYIALDSASAESVEKIQLDLLDLNVDVIWVPDMRSYNLVNHSIYNLAGNPAVAINQSPLTSPGPGPLYKSIMDKVVATVAILFLSPLLLVTAIAVKISSPGPVIFKQKRHGFDGEQINIWKFRSMKVHQEEGNKVTQAQKQDMRITPVGAFLRKTSIDELPQLFNVLQGRMSLVGPRPHAVAHNDFYSKKIDAYLVRHRMKPGITGLAQISGYRGETDSLEKMEKRVEYDLAYINNWSLMLDIKILLKTPLSLIRDEAY